MEDVTREQRQAARNRAWRKNGHSGGKNKASQHQESDPNEPIRCKMPSKKDNKDEEMVPVRPKPAVSHKVSQHQESDLDEPVPCKMPSKKYDKGEKMVLVRPKPVASPRTKDH